MELLDKMKETVVAAKEKFMSFSGPARDEYDDDDDNKVLTDDVDEDEEETEETEKSEKRYGGYSFSYEDEEDDDEEDDDEDEDEQGAFSPEVIGRRARNDNKVVQIGSHTHTKKRVDTVQGDKMLSRSITNIQEAEEAAKALMDGTKLLISFDVSDGERTKLLHFLAGVAYAVDAKFDIIKNGVFVFYPNGTVLEGDMKRGSDYLRQ